MLKLYDSHTHLNHKAFDEDRDETWSRAVAAGVKRGLVVGWDLESSRGAIEFARRHEGLTAAVGVSPHDACEAPEDFVDRLRELAAEPEVTAVGEIGLEYHHPAGPKSVLQDVFAAQLDLAIELNLPVVIHNRLADDDLLQALETHRPPGGVLHCYCSGVETMQAGVALGLHISLSGIVTFKNNGGLGDVIEAVPEDRLLIETDCPYLAPTPKRGKRCEPAMVESTLLTVAERRGVSPESLATVTFRNAETLFQARGETVKG